MLLALVLSLDNIPLFLIGSLMVELGNFPLNSQATLVHSTTTGLPSDLSKTGPYIQYLLDYIQLDNDSTYQGLPTCAMTDKLLVAPIIP